VTRASQETCDYWTTISAFRRRHCTTLNASSATSNGLCETSADMSEDEAVKRFISTQRCNRLARRLCQHYTQHNHLSSTNGRNPSSGFYPPNRESKSDATSPPTFWAQVFPSTFELKSPFGASSPLLGEVLLRVLTAQ